MTFQLGGQKKEKNAYVDDIDAVASGGVGDSVGAVVIFLYLQISILILLLPLCEIIKTMKQSFSIYQTSLLAFGRHRPPLPTPHQLCHSLL